jgi:hypothetical protein
MMPVTFQNSHYLLLTQVACLHYLQEDVGRFHQTVFAFQNLKLILLHPRILFTEKLHLWLRQLQFFNLREQQDHNASITKHRYMLEGLDQRL